MNDLQTQKTSSNRNFLVVVVVLLLFSIFDTFLFVPFLISAAVAAAFHMYVFCAHSTWMSVICRYVIQKQQVQLYKFQLEKIVCLHIRYHISCFFCCCCCCYSGCCCNLVSSNSTSTSCSLYISLSLLLVRTLLSVRSDATLHGCLWSVHTDVHTYVGVCMFVHMLIYVNVCKFMYMCLYVSMLFCLFIYVHASDTANYILLWAFYYFRSWTLFTHPYLYVCACVHFCLCVCVPWLSVFH